MRLAWRLAQFVETDHLGLVYAAGTGFVLANGPGSVRIADVAFVSQKRLAAQPVGVGFRQGAPDLAAEVLEPTDLYTDVIAKVSDWLDGGTQLVLVIDPRRRTVTVYRSRIDIIAMTEGDQFDGGTVVPGWILTVADLFL